MLKVLLSSLAGTSLMTAYSYWKAKENNEQFEEPELLSKLAHRLAPDKISTEISIPMGWITHYAIGYAFNMAYDQVWKRGVMKPGIFSGLLLGAPSGLLGMAAWATAFKLHPDPPKTHLKNHLKQLFVAHILFGTSSAFAYKALRNS